MTTQQFNDLINRLAPGDFDVIRGYVLDTVRAEFGPLIQRMEAQVNDQPNPAGPDYILGVVQEAYGPLIQEMREHVGQATDEDVTEDIGLDDITEDEDDDESDASPRNFTEFMASIGLGPIDKSKTQDAHIRLHALQMAVGVDMHRVEHQGQASDPMPLAITFYNFLTGNQD